MVMKTGDEAAAATDFRILGPLVVVSSGTELRIATRRMRALMVLLLMGPGRAVPTERLIDQLWDGSAPPQAAVTLRSYISNLRQALGGQEGLGGVLVTRAEGYAIDVSPERVDAFRLGVLATQGREMLRQGRTAEALARFEAAVGLWTGDPLADVADHEAAQSTITQLHETYLGAAEGRFEALLRSGRHQDALPALEAFVKEHPLQEAPHAQLMLALYRAGRAPEALAVHQRFRVLLNDELGIDPSAQLDELHQRILTQDRGLDLAPELLGPEFLSMTPLQTSGSRRASPPLAPSAARPVADEQHHLVGRERELAALVARLHSLTSTRSGSLLLLAGEPGIGKTTLLEALERQARADGVAVHTGRTPAAVMGAPPFWAWTQILESLAATLGDDELREATTGVARAVTRLAPMMADRLGQAAPVVGENAQALRFLLYESVSTFVRQATGNRPTVFILDDIHWADAPSLELLSYITGTLSSRPLLILAAYRDLPAERSADLDACLATVSREDTVYEVAVPGLGVRQVEELIFDVPEGALPPISDVSTRGSLATLMHDRTGGNPFFIRQLARLLTEAQPATAEEAFVPLPAGVRHVITNRLNALSDPTRDLLNVAALMGRDFEVGLPGKVTGLTVEQTLDAYDEAARHGLLEVSNAGASTRRFTHALVQETLVAGLPRGRASKLHAAIAEQLQQGARVPPEVVARHMWEARDVVGTSAVPSQLAAADSAAQVFAYAQAQEHLRRALELVVQAVPSNPSLELQLLLKLFRLIATERGWGDPDARAVVDRARQLASPATYNDATAVLWWSLFFSLMDRDDHEAYLDVARSLLTVINDDSFPGGVHGRPTDDKSLEESLGSGPGVSAAVHLMNVFRYLGEGDRGAAEQQLRSARSGVEAAALTEVQAFDENLHVMLLLIEGAFAALSGDEATYRSTTDVAVALADADGRPFPRALARTLAAVNATYLPAPTHGGELAQAARKLNDRYGFSSLAIVASSVAAWAAAHDTTPWEDAAREIEDNVQALSAAGRLGAKSSIRLLLADVYAIGQREDAAREVLEDAAREPGAYRDLFVAHLERRGHQPAADR
jgi:DNA-binding SARP family transcriptional activator/DNA polymerase III delta prime subunit